MSRMMFAQGKNKSRPLGYSEFKNAFTMQYCAVSDINGKDICEYLRMVSIEKTYPYAYDPTIIVSEPVRWENDPRPQWGTHCIACWSFTEEHPGTHVIKVDNSHDMLPLYMKWALRLGGATFDKDGWIDNESYGHEGTKLNATLSRLYEEINGKHRLKNFYECKCDKCKKEWIVFEDEPTQPALP